MAAMWTPLLLAALALAHDPTEGVVRLEQGRATCAGTLLPDGRVITAYHCVASGGGVRVHTRDGARGKGRAVAARRDADLAILRVEGLNARPGVELAPAAPGPGAAVRVVGHPYGSQAPQGFLEGTLRWSVAAGIVSAVGPVALQLDAPVNPGNSGGPVLDEAGRLVGVVSRKSAGGEGLGFAGRVELVEALAEEAPGRLGPVGGTILLQPLATVMDQRGGLFAVGPSLEIAFRDRVVLGGAWAVPLSARWGAVAAGEVRWIGPEARLGLRQRLFHGPWTVTLDGWAGVGGLHRLRGEVESSAVRLRREVELMPLAGGRLTVGAVGLELAVLADGSLRTGMALRWPSFKSVF